MSKITINGKDFDGKNVEINNGTVTIDGNEENVNLSDGIDLKMKSEGGEQSANVSVTKNTKLEIHQTSKKGDNVMKISF